MKDLVSFINLGLTIVGIILICLFIGNKTNNMVLWIIIGIAVSLLYLLRFMVKK